MASTYCMYYQYAMASTPVRSLLVATVWCACICTTKRAVCAVMNCCDALHKNMCSASLSTEQKLTHCSGEDIHVSLNISGLGPTQSLHSVQMLAHSKTYAASMDTNRSLINHSCDFTHCQDPNRRPDRRLQLRQPLPLPNLRHLQKKYMHQGFERQTAKHASSALRQKILCTSGSDFKIV